MKLLAVAEQLVARTAVPMIAVRVHPAMVPADAPARRRSAAPFNAVFVEGDAAGELMLFGRGAGGRPTASAVLGDLIDAARNLLGPRAACARPAAPSPTIRPMGDLRCAVYVSIDVADRPGVLAAVAKVFGDHDVSIRSMEQVGLADEARLIFMTHLAREGDLLATLASCASSTPCDRVGGVIRVVGGR